ncbi:uncharacterized protein LOC135340988 isoform X1 [Halichondria panicea]|uniref:uncharacterized protein LOC135340988 isoform X1 n=1 Tax=Halichondria panicea TaxID=6063 RepID=UPI00312BAB47
MKVLKILLLDLVLLRTVIRSYGNAQQLYCPGQNVELSCTDTAAVIWQGSAFTGQCPNESDTIIVIAAQAVVGSTTTCGIFTANVTGLTPSAVQGVNIVDVSLTFRADVSLNGTTVQCEDANPNDALLVNELLDIPATTTPILVLSQNSQSMVGVAFVIDDPRCVAMYHVNVTQEGGPTTSVSGSSSPVSVDGLDLCLYSYSFVGYTTSMTGEVSGVSISMDLTVNLTAINGVNVVVNEIDPVIEWNRIDSTLYPTCITGYVVADLGNPSLTTNVTSTVTSLTAQQLNAAGFPYCISIQPTVTPMTPVGDLATAVGSSNLTLIDPDFPTPILTYSFALVNQSENVTGVVVLRVTVQNIIGSLIETTAYSYTCNRGPMFSFVTFTGDYFEIELPQAEGRENVGVNVEFVYGQCMSSMAADFTVPGKNITGIIQGQSTDTSYTVTITLPLTPYQPEELLIISTVEPSNGNPIMADFSRPVMQYSVTFDNLMAATSYTSTIRIVLRANTTVDVVPAATRSFMTLMFPIMYTATTPPPTTMATTTIPSQAPSQSTAVPQGGGCGGGCIAGIIIGCLIVLLIVVVIVAIVLCYWNKTRTEPKVSSHEMEQQRTKVKLTTNDEEEVDLMTNCNKPESPPTSGTVKLGPVYEDSDAFKVDPHTQDNLAYGHVQQSAQLKGPIYEDIKPDPHTQENLSYGHVQFN